MKRRWVWFSAVLALGLLGSLPSFALETMPPDAKVVPLGEPGTAWEALQPGVRGSTFRTAMFGNPQTWNPLTAVETATTVVTNLLYHGLVTLNPITADIEPALAKEWTFSADGLTITFSLRQGVRWSDGEPFTADDVLFTFNDVILNPDVVTTARDSLKLPDGTMPAIEKVDDYTVRVSISTPYRPLLSAMGKRILPRHKWAGSVLPEPGASGSFLGLDTSPADVVGTGPYVLESFLPDQAVILKRNPHYYVYDGSGVQLPYYDRRIIRIESSSDLALLQFLNGELDAFEPQSVDLPLLTARGATRGYTVLIDRALPIYGSAWLCFNQDIGLGQGTDDGKRSVYRDLRFRQAFAHLIDKDGMIDALFHGLAVPQWSAVSMGSPFYAGRAGYGGAITEDGAVTFAYAPELAAALLDEVGLVDRDGDGWRDYPSGERATLDLSTVAGQSDYEGECLILVESARRVGLNLRYTPQDVNLVLAGLFTGGFDIVLLGFTGGADPNVLASAYLPCGRMHFWSRTSCAEPSTDEGFIASLFEAGISTLDVNEAFGIYRDLQVETARQANLIYTVYPLFRFAYYDHVGNAEMANPNGHPSAENGFAADIAFDRRLAP